MKEEIVKILDKYTRDLGDFEGVYDFQYDDIADEIVDAIKNYSKHETIDQIKTQELTNSETFFLTQLCKVSIYSFDVFKSVYLQVNSYEKTIKVLQDCMENNLSVYESLNQNK